MEEKKIRRLWASLTLIGLMFSQFTTGVFPIPIAPVDSAYAAGFFIEKTRIDADEDEPVGPGDTIRYEIEIRNNDSKDANARIIDPIPDELEFVSGSNGCEFVPATPGRFDEVICAQQPLPIGASRNVTITFRVKSDVRECIMIENQGDVWNDDPNYPNGIPPSWSNVVRTPTDCPDPELEVTKTVNKSSVIPGDSLQYSIRVENTGSGLAEDIEIIDNIPSGLIWSSGSSGCSATTSRVTCDIPDLNEGGYHTVTLNFTVDSTIQPNDNRCGGNIVNQATADGSNTDPDTSNSVTTRLDCPSPTLVAVKRIKGNVTTVQPGDQIEYEIEVDNTGNADALNVKIIDAPANGLAYNDGDSHSYCNKPGAVVECIIPEIRAGRDKTINIVFDITSSAPCGGSIPNKANVEADNASSTETNTVSVSVSCPQPDIDLTKSGPATIIFGEELVYTLDIDNNGNGTAEDIVITDHVPAAIDITEITSNLCSFNASNVVTCDPFDRNAGTETLVYIKGFVDEPSACGTTLQNNFSVSAANHGNVTSNTVNTLVLCPEPDLDLTKSGPTSVTAGEDITYNFTIRNTGDAVANNVYVYDIFYTQQGGSRIDLPFDFKNSTGLSCSKNNAEQWIECNVGNLNPGATKSFSITFETTDGEHCDENIYNNADAHVNQVAGSASDWDNHTVRVNCLKGDLDIQKTGATSITAGGNMTYTFTVTNTGNGIARDVRVADYFQTAGGATITPAPFTNPTFSGASCTFDNTIVSCTLGDINPGANKTFSVTFETPANTYCGQNIKNNADVHENPANSSDWDGHTVRVNCPDPDVRIVKAGPASITQGDQITYTITIYNDGDGIARDIVLVDTVASDITITNVTSNICSHSNNVVSCDPFDMQPHTDTSFTIVGTYTGSASCGGSIQNTTYGAVSNGGNVQSNTVTTSVHCPAPNLSVQKVPSKTSVIPGDTVVYTITVTNSGDADATNVRVTDNIPTGLTFIDGSPTDSDCDDIAGQIVCGPRTVQDGDDQEFDIAFTVNNSAPCNGSILNRADVTSDQTGSIYDTASIAVSCPEPDLDIQKTGPATVTSGDNITYNFSIRNNGNAVATDVHIEDFYINAGGNTITAPFNYISDTGADCTDNGTVVSCNGIGNINPGETKYVSITFETTVNQYCDQYFTNKVDAEENPADPNSSDSSTHTVRVVCPDPDLELTKSADLTDVNFGETVTYTLSVENKGPGIAYDVIVSDPIPSGLTYVGSNNNSICSKVGNIIECKNFDMDPGDIVDFELTFRVDSLSLCYQNVANRGTAEAQNHGVVYSNTVNVFVHCPASDLSITKTQSVNTVEPGDNITYYITVENTGTGPAENVEIIDTLPTGITANSYTGNNCVIDTDIHGNQIVHCQGLTIPAGGSFTLTIYAEANSLAPCDGSVTNHVSASANDHGTITDTVTASVNCPKGDLRITKTGQSSTVAGDNIMYSFSVTNIGAGIANDVRIDDYYLDSFNQTISPAPFTFLSSSEPTCDSDGTTVDCELGDMNPGQTINFTMTFSTPGNSLCNSVVRNRADAKENPEIPGRSDYAIASTAVNCPDAELKAIKTSDKDVVEHGDIVIFTINVENISNVDALNVKVIDPKPDHLMFLGSPTWPSDPMCQEVNNVIECGDFDLAAGDDRDIDIAFKVLDSAPCGNIIANLADVTSDNAPTTWSNQKNLDVICPELQASKVHSTSIVEPGDTLTYTIHVDNVGQTDEEDLTVSDIVPTGLTYISQGVNDPCSYTAGVVTCGPFDLDAGDPIEFNLHFDVTDQAPCNNYLNNFATVQYLTGGATLTTTNITETFVDCPQSDFTATKSVDKAHVVPGDTLTYTFDLVNTGDTDLTGLWIIDTIPAGLTFIPSTTPGGSDPRCFKQGLQVKCGDDPILEGTSDTYTMVFTVNEFAPCDGTMENYAMILFLGNNIQGQTNTVFTDVTCPQADLDILKNGPNKVIAGEEVTYDFTVTNNGGATAQDVLLVDFFTDLVNVKTVPAPFTFVSASGAVCISDGTDVTCELGDIAAGGVVNFSMTFSIPDGLYCDQSIRNNADLYEQPLNSGSSDWDDHIVVVECLEPDLEIQKTGPVTIDAGDQVTYSFTIENEGDGDAENVQFSDSFITAGGATIFVPPFTFASSNGATCIPVTFTVQCDLGTIAANDAMSFTITFDTPASTFCDETIYNEATVSESSVPTLETDTHALLVRCLDPDIQSSKVANKTVVTPGETLTYTINVDNVGTGDATGLTMEDQVPTGLTYDDASSDPRCDETAGLITCGTFDLTAGTDTDFDLVFTVNNLAPCDGQISNSATVVDAAGADVDTTNTVYTDVLCPEPNLEATKSVDQPVVQHLDIVTFTIEVENTGNAEAVNVSIEDPVPNHLMYLDPTSDPLCDLVGGNTVECGDFNLGAGDTRSVDIQFKVLDTAPCSEIISNLADVFADNAATVWSNVVQIDVNCTTDFVATKYVDKTTTSPGEKLTYRVDVENTGQTILGGLWIIDTIPTGLSFDGPSSDIRCFEQGGQVKCGDDDINPGQTDSYTIVFDVTNDAPCNGSISNIADLIFLDNNNLAGVTNVVTTAVTCPVPDVQVEKFVDKTVIDGANLSEALTYDIVITNTGTQTLTGIWVIDPIFIPGISFDHILSDPRCFVQGGDIKCGDDDILPGQSDTYTIALTVETEYFCNSSINNRAEVITNEVPQTFSNTVYTQVTDCPNAELEVTKTANRTTAKAGDIVTYTLTVHNPSTVEAFDVEVFDNIIPELTYRDDLSSPLCDTLFGEVVCGPVDLNGGDTITYYIAFEVSAYAACDSTIYNQVEATASNADPALSNSEHVDIECDDPEADLWIEKLGPGQILRGETIIYDVVIHNNGPDAAEGIVVTDEIPVVFNNDGTQLLDLTFNQSLSNGACFVQGDDVICQLSGDLAAYDNETIKIAFDVPDLAGCSKPIINYVEVSALTFDPLTGNNDAEHVSTANCATGTLDIEKFGPASAKHGDLITYTIIVENNLGYDVTRNRMIDPIPGNLEFVSADDPSCYYATIGAGPEIICGEFDLAAGASRTFELTFRVLNSAPCDYSITNIADIWSEHGGVDPEWSNAIRTLVLCDAEFDITKTDNRLTARPNDVLEYDILVTNISTVDAVNQEIVDELPADVEFISANAGGVYDSFTHTVTWIIDVDAGDTELLSVVGQIQSYVQGGEVLLNEACVIDGYFASVCGLDTTVIEQDDPDFVISKTDYQDFVSPGDDLHYVITVTNISGTDATNVEITDTLSPLVDFISTTSQPVGVTVSQLLDKVTWIADIDAGETIQLWLSTAVKNTAQDGEIVINEVCVDEVTGDDCDIDTTIVDDAQPSFTINKTDNRSTVEAGEQLQYNIIVTNNSTADAVDVEIIDELPANVTFVSATSGGQHIGDEVMWTVDLDAGDSISLDVTVLTSQNAQNGDLVVNVACVEAIECDDDYTTITVVQAPDLSIIKTDNRSTVVPGETLTYDITVSNTGTADANDLVVQDTLPSGVTFVSATAGGTFSNGVVTWNNIDVAPNAGETFSVVVTVNSNATDGQVLFNTVEIVNENVEDDDTTTVVVNPTETGCIDVIKETFDAQGVKLNPVTQFTFTLDGSTQTAVNDSTGRARFNNVTVGAHTVTETIPNGWVQNSVAPAGGNVTVLPGTNCVTVTFKNSQTPVGNARFTISKTDNKATAEVDDELRYQMEITNISNIDATNVEVTDRLPDNTDYISSTDGGSRNGDTITWNFNLDAGETEKFEMRVKVNNDADDGDVITNTVIVTDGPSATDTTRIEDEDDDDDDNDDDDDDNDDDDDEIRVSINDDPDPIDVCHDDDLEYEIRLTNSSNGNERVDVTADLDSDTDYQSSSDGGKLKSGDRVEWDNVKVNRNGSKTLRLRVRVEDDARDGNTLRLRVRVSGGESDTEITRVRNNNCHDDDDDDRPGEPQLSIDKTADRTEALANSVASYTITIRNTGDRDLPNATLTDDYPESQISISDPGGGADAGGLLQWNLGTLKANSTTVVRYRVRVRPDVSQGAFIRNTATVRAGPLTRSDDHTIVVPTPPQTGLTGFIKSLTKSERYLSDSETQTQSDTENMVAVVPQERVAASVISEDASSNSASLPIIVWITTMATGLGMGGLFGRKFLF